MGGPISSLLSDACRKQLMDLAEMPKEVCSEDGSTDSRHYEFPPHRACQT
ncbi:hypothetical protein T4E_7486 [Trichinella pseudospiralis]|uniref:Uncharacterized protein n=1 Tax=Trichinella pseudospiralis TaxID=6337 RepID=A0A0V0WA65_TRIPS|nr:hypothetical protein T4E_7486 [Trichinella pseudospiralis]